MNYYNSVRVLDRVIKEKPFLTLEENRELAKLYKDGNKRAKEIMFEGNLKLVLSIVKPIILKNPDIDEEDILQESLLSMYNAIDTYNPDKGAFSSYVTQGIKRMVYRYIDSARNPYHVPCNIQELFYKYKMYKDNMGYSDEEICKSLGITLEKLNYLRKLEATKNFSFDEPIESESLYDNDIRLSEHIGENDKKYDDVLNDYEDKILLLIAKEILTPYNYYVLYHMILSKNPKTQSELALILKSKRQGISQAQTRALKKMESLLKDKTKYLEITNQIKKKYGISLKANPLPLDPNDLLAFKYIKNDLCYEEQVLYYLLYVLREEYTKENLANILKVDFYELAEIKDELDDKIKNKFQDKKKYDRFKEDTLKTYGSKIFNEIPEQDKEIDYNRLSRKYSDFTYEDLYSIYKEEIDEISYKEQLLLEEYFGSELQSNKTLKDLENVINLVHYGYRREENQLKIKDLYTSFLKNLDEFNEEQQLYLECFYFKHKPINLFLKLYPTSIYLNDNSSLINKLEKIHFNIYKLFEMNVPKEKYIEIKRKYGQNLSKKQIKYLDLYYGLVTEPMSYREIANYLNEEENVTKNFIYNTKCHLLSLSTNNSVGIEIDKSIYKSYIDNPKIHMPEETKRIFKMFVVENKDYEQIKKVTGKTSTQISNIILLAMEKIDYYRFNISDNLTIPESEIDEICKTSDYLMRYKNIIKLHFLDNYGNTDIGKICNLTRALVSKVVNVFYKTYLVYKTRTTILEDNDYIIEINKPISDSVLSEEEKKILSLYFGIKSNYNKSGYKFPIVDISNFFKDSEENINKKIKDSIHKIKCLKEGLIRPLLSYMPYEELKNILNDCHLPISKTDKVLINHLFELNGYPYKSLKELSLMFNISLEQARNKYRCAIIKIKKYINGEIDGIINYEIDIMPNLKYFPKSDRLFIIEYFKNNLTYKEIGNKYNIPTHSVQNTLINIKNYLYDLINNKNCKKFDFDFYEKAIKDPRLPFYGNLEIATKAFDLYYGQNSIKKYDAKDIKRILNIESETWTISKMISTLMISCLKLRAGVYKAKEFSYEEVKEYYNENKNKLSKKTLRAVEHYLDNYLGTKKLCGSRLKVPQQITLNMLKRDFNYIKIRDLTKDDIKLFLTKYKSKLSINERNSLLAYFDLPIKDYISGKKVNHVFKILDKLEKKKATSKKLLLAS